MQNIYFNILLLLYFILESISDSLCSYSVMESLSNKWKNLFFWWDIGVAGNIMLFQIEGYSKP